MASLIDTRHVRPTAKPILADETPARPQDPGRLVHEMGAILDMTERLKKHDHIETCRVKRQRLSVTQHDPGNGVELLGRQPVFGKRFLSRHGSESHYINLTMTREPACGATDATSHVKHPHARLEPSRAHHTFDHALLIRRRGPTGSRLIPARMPVNAKEIQIDRHAAPVVLVDQLGLCDHSGSEPGNQLRIRERRDGIERHLAATQRSRRLSTAVALPVCITSP